MAKISYTCGKDYKTESALKGHITCKNSQDVHVFMYMGMCVCVNVLYVLVRGYMHMDQDGVTHIYMDKDDMAHMCTKMV